MPVCIEESVITVSLLRQFVNCLQTKELNGCRSRQYNRACVDVLAMLTIYQMRQNERNL